MLFHTLKISKTSIFIISKHLRPLTKGIRKKKIRKGLIAEFLRVFKRECCGAVMLWCNPLTLQPE